MARRLTRRCSRPAAARWLRSVGVIVFLAACGKAQDSGDWQKATAAPTAAFSGLSVQDARAKALAENRLLLVDTTAEWCGPCRQMDKTTWRDQRVLDWIGNHAVAVQVDVDRLPDVAKSLGISAMPTIVVFREGVELERSTGLQVPSELLAWLDRLQQRERGDRQLVDVSDGTVPYEGVPDTGTNAPLLRHTQAEVAMRAGRFDEALPQLEWLWVHGAERSPSYSAVRLSFLVSTMRELAEAYPPAHQSFAHFLESAQAEIDRGHVSRDVWNDWEELCEMIGEGSRIETWYERHRDPDGSIDGPYGRVPWIAQSLFDRLARLERYGDAGRIYRWPSVPIEKAISLNHMLKDAKGEGATGLALRLLDPTDRNDDRLRQSAARLSAALIAAGRVDDARQIAKLLLTELDDGESRKALVTFAIQYAHPLPDHVRWFAEAAETDIDLGDLEVRFEAALAEHSQEGSPVETPK